MAAPLSVLKTTNNNRQNQVLKRGKKITVFGDM